VAIGDLNGEGKPDLATANYNSNTGIGLARQRRTGASGEDRSWDGKLSLLRGDRRPDGDGKADLVTANF